MKKFLQALQTLFILLVGFGSLYVWRDDGGFYTRVFSWSLFGIGAAGCTIWTVFGLWQPYANPGPGLGKCPDCGAKLPAVRIPKSRREMLWGGVTCPRCGCELDRSGNKIEKKEDSDRS